MHITSRDLKDVVEEEEEAIGQPSVIGKLLLLTIWIEKVHLKERKEESKPKGGFSLISKRKPTNRSI